MDSNFSDRLKALRVGKGLRQIDVADATGLTAASYNRYEKGVSFPRADTILLIANFFQVTPDYLVFGEQGEEYKAQEKHIECVNDFSEQVPKKYEALNLVLKTHGMQITKFDSKYRLIWCKQNKTDSIEVSEKDLDPLSLSVKDFAYFQAVNLYNSKRGD